MELKAAHKLAVHSLSLLLTLLFEIAPKTPTPIKSWEQELQVEYKYVGYKSIFKKLLMYEDIG